jgi:hypothetical protein
VTYRQLALIAALAFALVALSLWRAVREPVPDLIGVRVAPGREC